MSLYDHVEALAVVDTWFDEHLPDIEKADGEVPEELVQVLDMATGDFNEKAERVALKVNQLLAESSAIGDEADRLARRAKSRKARADYLKRYLHLCLTKARVQKVPGLLVTVRLQKSPPSVVNSLTQQALGALYMEQLNEAAEGMNPIATFWVDKVPASFKLDTKAVLAAHRAGEPLPDGITVEQGNHLRID